jgi:hypothetical protein
MKTLKGTALTIVVAVVAVLGCSTDEPDACTTDLDCKGDRICGASGQCTDVGDSGSETPSSSDVGSGDPKRDGGSSVDPAPDTPSSTDGEACALSGSDCDPDCLISCGSPECVDLCCSDSTSAGVICDGQCREPLCTEGEDTVSEDERPWGCFETAERPCFCTNSYTEEDVLYLLDQGGSIVPNCPAESCAFDFDGGDWTCSCNVEDPPTEVVFEYGYGAGPIDDCSTMPVARCVDPCEGMVLVE